MLSYCLALSALTASLGWYSHSTLKSVSENYEMIMNQNLPNLRTSYRMFVEYRGVRIRLVTLGMTGISEKENAKEIKSALEGIEAYEKLDAEFTGDRFLPGEEEIYKKVAAEWALFKPLALQILELAKSAKAEDRERITRITLDQFPERGKQFRTAMLNLLEFHDKISETRRASAHETMVSGTRTVMVFVVFGILFSLIFGFWISQQTTSVLSMISLALGESAKKVSTVAQHIGTSSESLSASTVQQAAALQETSAAVEETSSMISRNADNAKSSSEVSKQSVEVVQKGQSAVVEVVHSINEIATSNEMIMRQIEQSNQDIAGIVQVIRDIESKTKVINDIVFQTKLLSFNASVEAARAGELGKGFAVVAEEVGNLAQLSGQSAKEIAEMLDGSIQQVERIVSKTKSQIETMMISGKEKIQQGTETARRCDQIFAEVVTNVGEVGRMVDEISEASQEQARGIREINKSMTEMDAVGQKNSMASQQASASSEELNGQVLELEQMTQRLDALILGRRAS